MIEIKNLRSEFPKEPWQIRIDRKTVFGNPFVISKDFGRDQVCDLYEEYFNKRLESADDEHFMYALTNLKEKLKQYGKLELFCWCYPQRCHGETIRKYLLEEK